MNKIMIIPVGLPRAGKSTYFEKNLANKDIVVVSRDLIREVAFGDKSNMSNEDEVSNIFDNTLAEALKNEKNIFIDNTNLKLKYRKKFYELAEQNGYEIHVVLFFTDFHTLKERAEKTGFPFEVIVKMAQGMDMVNMTEEEPIDNLKIITMTKYDSPWDYVAEVEDYEQNSKYHNLTLGGHLKQTHQNLLELNPEIAEVGAFHDIAKPFCRVPKDDGTSSYPGHGVPSAYQYATIMSKHKDYETEILPYSLLISKHMDRFQDYGDKYIKKTKKQLELHGLRWYDLATVWEADSLAHGDCQE